MKTCSTTLLAAMLATAVGCQDSADQFVNKTNLTDKAVIQHRTTMLLNDQPADAKTVVEVRDRLATAEQLEAVPVVVTGTVGGMPNPFPGDENDTFPWFEKMSAFSLVDPTSAEQFDGHNHDDGEECIWCNRKAQELADTVATVVLSDSTGSIIPERADRLLLLKEGATVVVRGMGRIELGVLKIAADGLYVLPE